MTLFQTATRTQVPLKTPVPIKRSVASVEWQGIINMSPADWARIPDNPRQRDTARHAKSATHLFTAHPTHARVNMAELPDGRLFKLDGHSRSYLWSTDKAEPPRKLAVDVWLCQTLDDVKSLYNTFDSRSAVESVTDQVHGALREQDLTFESELLQSQKFAGALRHAYEFMYGAAKANALSAYELISYWKSELLLLDPMMPTRRRFDSGLTAAALICLARYGEQATEFWESYSRDTGLKGVDEQDYVITLEKKMIERKDRKMATTGRNGVHSTVGWALVAFDRHRKGQIFKRGDTGFRGMDARQLGPWLDAAKKAKLERDGK